MNSLNVSNEARAPARKHRALAYFWYSTCHFYWRRESGSYYYVRVKLFVSSIAYIASVTICCKRAEWLRCTVWRRRASSYVCLCRLTMFPFIENTQNMLYRFCVDCKRKKFAYRLFALSQINNNINLIRPHGINLSNKKLAREMMIWR